MPFHISLEGSVAPLEKQWLNPTFVLEDGVPSLKTPRTCTQEETKLGPSCSQTILGGPSVTGKSKGLILRRQHNGGSPSPEHQVHDTCRHCWLPGMQGSADTNFSPSSCLDWPAHWLGSVGFPARTIFSSWNIKSASGIAHEIWECLKSTRCGSDLNPPGVGMT